MSNWASRYFAEVYFADGYFGSGEAGAEGEISASLSGSSGLVASITNGNAAETAPTFGGAAGSGPSRHWYKQDRPKKSRATRIVPAYCSAALSGSSTFIAEATALLASSASVAGSSRLASNARGVGVVSGSAAAHRRLLSATATGVGLSASRIDGRSTYRSEIRAVASVSAAIQIESRPRVEALATWLQTPQASLVTASISQSSRVRVFAGAAANASAELPGSSSTLSIASAIANTHAAICHGSRSAKARVVGIADASVSVSHMARCVAHGSLVWCDEDEILLLAFMSLAA